MYHPECARFSPVPATDAHLRAASALADQPQPVVALARERYDMRMFERAVPVSQLLPIRRTFSLRAANLDSTNPAPWSNLLAHYRIDAVCSRPRPVTSMIEALFGSEERYADFRHIDAMLYGATGDQNVKVQFAWLQDVVAIHALFYFLVANARVYEYHPGSDRYDHRFPRYLYLMYEQMDLRIRRGPEAAAALRVIEDAFDSERLAHIATTSTFSEFLVSVFSWLHSSGRLPDKMTMSHCHQYGKHQSSRNGLLFFHVRGFLENPVDGLEALMMNAFQDKAAPSKIIAREVSTFGPQVDCAAVHYRSMVTTRLPTFFSHTRLEPSGLIPVQHIRSPTCMRLASLVWLLRPYVRDQSCRGLYRVMSIDERVSGTQLWVTDSSLAGGERLLVDYNVTTSGLASTIPVPALRYAWRMTDRSALALIPPYAVMFPDSDVCETSPLYYTRAITDYLMTHGTALSPVSSSLDDPRYRIHVRGERVADTDTELCIRGCVCFAHADTPIPSTVTDLLPVLFVPRQPDPVRVYAEWLALRLLLVREEDVFATFVSRVRKDAYAVVGLLRQLERTDCATLRHATATLAAIASSAANVSTRVALDPVEDWSSVWMEAASVGRLLAAMEIGTVAPLPLGFLDYAHACLLRVGGRVLSRTAALPDPPPLLSTCTIWTNMGPVSIRDAIQLAHSRARGLMVDCARQLDRRRTGTCIKLAQMDGSVVEWSAAVRRSTSHAPPYIQSLTAALAAPTRRILSNLDVVGGILGAAGGAPRDFTLHRVERACLALFAAVVGDIGPRSDLARAAHELSKATAADMAVDENKTVCRSDLFRLVTNAIRSERVLRPWAFRRAVELAVCNNDDVAPVDVLHQCFMDVKTNTPDLFRGLQHGLLNADVCADPVIATLREAHPDAAEYLPSMAVVHALARPIPASVGAPSPSSSSTPVTGRLDRRAATQLLRAAVATPRTPRIPLAESLPLPDRGPGPGPAATPRPRAIPTSLAPPGTTECMHT
jgi:hypothetical protein